MNSTEPPSMIASACQLMMAQHTSTEAKIAMNSGGGVSRISARMPSMMIMIGRNASTPSTGCMRPGSSRVSWLPCACSALAMAGCPDLLS